MPALGAVAHFEPFRGTRYAAGTDLALVTAPPYDVLSEGERDAHAARHAHNIVLVDVPMERDGPGRYELAAGTLRRWLDDGVLVSDPEPVFYLYRTTFTDEAGRRRTTSGVLGALEVVAPGPDAEVLPHEHTTPKAKTDRLELTRATGANLSPVWGLSLAPDLADVINAPGMFLGELTDPDGVVHRVEEVDNPARTEAIHAAIAGGPVVIADGHHRYEIARQYQAEQRAAHGGAEGPWDLTLALVTPLTAEQLSVRAIHRLVDVPPGLDLPAALAERFALDDVGPVDPSIVATLEERGALCLVRPDRTGVLLRPRPGAFADEPDLDSARLAAALDGLGTTITYEHGVEQVLDALEPNRYGVLLRPVGVAQIEAMARARALMPPKSTFFWPKPRTGLVLRLL